MYRFLLILSAVLALASSFVSPAAAKRVALVIGNSSYEHITDLRNPRNDAEDVAATLNRLGFEVIQGFDTNLRGLGQKVAEFGNAARDADTAVVFYAGHGLQVNGKNYLVPVDARLSNQYELAFQTVELTQIMNILSQVKNTKVVFLDACRNNPLTRDLARSMGTDSSEFRGLARVEARGTGSFIAFATEPGEVALDGAGENSPFTSALLNHIETPELDISLMMRRVRQEVTSTTDGKQVPWHNSSLVKDFYFVPSGEDAGPEAQPGTSPAVGRSDAAEAWENVKDTKNPAMLEVFIENFPDTIYADFARIRIRDLEREPQAADPCRQKWARVQDTELPGVVQEFLRECPTGSVASLAQDRLDFLRKQQDEREWNKARRRDTVASYDYYLEMYPDGAYASDARSRRRNLRDEQDQARERRRERSLWDQAKSANSVSAYEEYLDDFPNGAYASAARRAIARLEQPAQPPQRSTPPTRRKRVIIYNRQDFYGSDLYRVDDVNFDTCKQRCVQLSRCKAFTYNTRQSVCFLKHSVPVLQPYKYAISGKVVIE